jgi:hypothetical protein
VTKPVCTPQQWYSRMLPLVQARLTAYLLGIAFGAVLGARLGKARVSLRIQIERTLGASLCRLGCLGSKFLIESFLEARSHV